VTSLKGKTLFISGGSRGIGLCDRVARRARRRQHRNRRENPRSRIRSSRAPSTPPPTRSALPAARPCRSCAISATKAQVMAAIDKTVVRIRRHRHLRQQTPAPSA